MKLLGWEKTRRLWNRLDAESADYYRTLHSASADLRLLGPSDKSEREFSDLVRWENRLKWRFIVLWSIGRPYKIPHSPSMTIPCWNLSDVVMDRADQIIGLGWLKSELNQRGRGNNV